MYKFSVSGARKGTKEIKKIIPTQKPKRTPLVEINALPARQVEAFVFFLTSHSLAGSGKNHDNIIGFNLYVGAVFLFLTQTLLPYVLIYRREIDLRPLVC